MGQHRLSGIPGAGEIHRQGAVPDFVTGVLKQPLIGDASVVDQKLNGSQLRLGGPDHSLHGVTVGDIGADGDGLPALCPQEADQVLRGLPMLQVVDTDGPALPGQFHSNGPTDSPGGAGDQSSLLHTFTSLTILLKAV